MAAIHENIKMLREKRRWSKSEMAQRLGLGTYTTITKWEKGENHPRAVDLKKLCKLFGVTSDFLLGISDMNSPDCINYYRHYPVSVSCGVLDNVKPITEKGMKLVAMSDSVMGKYSGSNDVYFVDVNGDSMNKVIEDGSRIGLVYVENVTQLKDGDIVLFSVDNQFSIKRFFNDQKAERFVFRPESTNEKHIDIVVSYDEMNKLLIHGKVVINISQYS